MALSTALYFALSGLATGFQVYAPENIATVAGNPATISCGTDVNRSFVQWYFQSAVDKQELLIFNGRIGLSRFKVDNNNLGLCQIRIENATSFDAGTYRCVIRMRVAGGAETINEFKSELIVLESHPACTANASAVAYEGRIGDTLLLYCTVDYTGHWSPYMEWSRQDGKNITTMKKVFQQNSSITSTFELHLNPSDDGVTFSCKTAFHLSTEIKKSYVRNVPRYQFVWNYTANVLFGPQRIEITPLAESYSPNDRLFCSSDGNPNPSCTWIDLDANRVVGKGCLLLIDRNMRRDRMHHYQCRAENTIAGVRYYMSTNITYWVINQTETWKLRQNSIIGVAVVIIVVIVLVLVPVISKRKCTNRKCRSNASRECSTETPSLPHDYDSIIDADIPMSQLERDLVAMVQNMEEEEENAGNPEEGDQEEGSYFDTHSTPVNDTSSDSTHTTTRGDYSSLEVGPTTQPVVYIQLDAQAYERDEQTDVVSSVQHSYYNLP